MRRWGERLIYRQGNVLLLEVRTLPQDSLPLDHCVISKGKVRGFKHYIEDLKSAILYETIYSEDFYLQTITQASLIHPEHSCIILPENTVFKVIHQREYIPDENIDIRLLGKGMVIDKNDTRKLYAISLPYEESIVLVRVQCPSTGHENFLRVPPEARTCHEAVAWTFNMNSIDYRPTQET